MLLVKVAKCYLRLELPAANRHAFLLRYNYCWQALEHRSLKLTEMLEQTYAVSLAREALLQVLLQRIKQIYLGARPTGRGGLQDMMSTMMQALSGGHS